MALCEVVQIGIAVVEFEGRYLVGVRGPNGPLPGLHEFPGGKLLPGETPEAAAVRECLEETGLAVMAESMLATGEHDYPHGRVELFFVRCRPLAPRETALAGSFEWVPAATLSSLRFPAANQAVVAALVHAHA